MSTIPSAIRVEKFFSSNIVSSLHFYDLSHILGFNITFKLIYSLTLQPVWFIIPILCKIQSLADFMSITVAAGSKEWTVFVRSKAGIVGSSKTSVHPRSTRCHIPEDGVLHSHRREKLKSLIDKCVNMKRNERKL
jgi:hypothetical protein